MTSALDYVDVPMCANFEGTCEGLQELATEVAAMDHSDPNYPKEWEEAFHKAQQAIHEYSMEIFESLKVLCRKEHRPDMKKVSTDIIDFISNISLKHPK